VNKFRQLNKQLNSEVSAEDTSFMTSRQQQASNNDPIYISSPSHGAGAKNNIVLSLLLDANAHLLTCLSRREAVRAKLRIRHDR
jgi:hypothetical protein